MGINKMIPQKRQKPSLDQSEQSLQQRVRSRVPASHPYQCPVDRYVKQSNFHEGMRMPLHFLAAQNPSVTKTLVEPVFKGVRYYLQREEREDSQEHHNHHNIQNTIFAIFSHQFPSFVASLHCKHSSSSNPLCFLLGLQTGH